MGKWKPVTWPIFNGIKLYPYPGSSILFVLKIYWFKNGRFVIKWLLFFRKYNNEIALAILTECNNVSCLLSPNVQAYQAARINMREITSKTKHFMSFDLLCQWMIGVITCDQKLQQIWLMQNKNLACFGDTDTQFLFLAVRKLIF